MDPILASAAADFEKILAHLDRELGAIRAGGASPALIEHLTAEVYGAPTPIRALGNISAPEPSTLCVELWDAGAVAAVEKALHEAELGASPRTEGNRIFLAIPPMTAETREKFAKMVHAEGENARIAVRKSRESAKKSLDGAGLPEDDLRSAEKKLQESVDATNKKIEEKVAERKAAIRKV